MFENAKAGHGLDTYVSKKHIHPLHSLVSIFEALFGLLGLVVLVLMLSMGSFEKAGATLDKGYKSVIDGVKALTMGQVSKP